MILRLNTYRMLLSLLKNPHIIPIARKPHALFSSRLLLCNFLSSKPKINEDNISSTKKKSLDCDLRSKDEINQNLKEIKISFKNYNEWKELCDKIKQHVKNDMSNINCKDNGWFKIEKKIEEDEKDSTIIEEKNIFKKNENDFNGSHLKKSKIIPTSSDDQNDDGNNEKKTPFSNNAVINVNLPLLLAIGVTIGLIWKNLSVSQVIEISWKDFVTSLLERGAINEILVLENNIALISLRPDAPQFTEYPEISRHGYQYRISIGSVESFERKLDEIQDDLGIGVRDRISVVYRHESKLDTLLFSTISAITVLSCLFFTAKFLLSKFSGQVGAGGGPGGILGMVKSRARLYNYEKEVACRFKDVAGIDEAKEEIVEFVKFLKQPKIYERLGARIPRGAILSGPPGTGKTLLAKATAGEAGVPFYSVSGSEFVEMFVGVGASRVRDLFNTARKNTPCIIFIDEIDAIGKRRAHGTGSFGSNDERESTLNQILVEIDGFTSSEHVVVLAGTNRPDVLDPALMRPGRFDRHIVIDRPDVIGRTQIFKVHMKPLRINHKVDKDQMSRRMAALTPGFSGADIANVCNESALAAARLDANFVEREHFELAIERVIAGLAKKSKVLSKEERRIVAYHEAGHAVSGWYLEHADPLLKVSIIPRGSGALGYAQYVPKDLQLHSKEELLDRICMALSGRAAEEIFIGSITTGAQDDFIKVNKLIYAMLTRYGMNAKIGMVSYHGDNSETFGNMVKPYSESTAQLIDNQAREMIEEAYLRASKLLQDKSICVHKVAARLLEREVLSCEDLIQLLGERPYKKGFQIEEFVKGIQNADGSLCVRPN